MIMQREVVCMDNLICWMLISSWAATSATAGSLHTYIDLLMDTYGHTTYSSKVHFWELFIIFVPFGFTADQNIQSTSACL